MKCPLKISDQPSGPRGLGFESRHSDQIRMKSSDFIRIFLCFQNFFRWRILHIFRLTQTRPKRKFGAEIAGRENSPPAGAIPAGGVRVSVHFLSLSDACHEATDFLRGFFFHARRDVRVDIQRELRRSVTEDFRDCFRIDAALNGKC